MTTVHALDRIRSLFFACLFIEFGGVIEVKQIAHEKLSQSRADGRTA